MIVFHTLKYKNFLSTGNTFTEIVLDKDASTLIVGTNGAGKSTILEALCFVLFGKAFRKINKPNLVNSVNGKNCVVEVTFTTQGRHYRIVRGIKPTMFEIYANDQLVDQNARSLDYQEYFEKYILKMNFKSFTQIVILGAQSFTPFMQLTAADRRAIIEDLLDIQIFSVMNIIAKQKMQINREDVEKNRIEIRLLEEKKTLITQTLSSIHQNNETKLGKLAIELKNEQTEAEEIEGEISILNQQLDTLLEMVKDDAKLREKHKKLIQLQGKIQANLDRHEKSIDFYHDKDTCPTCHQIIDEVFKQKIISETNATITEIKSGTDKLSDEISKVVDEIVTMDQLFSDISDIRANLQSAKTNLTATNNTIKRLQSSIDELNKADNVIIENRANLKQVEKDIKKAQALQETLLSDRSYLELIISLLKDGGIKAKVIKQYLPIINKQINNYLAAMDFFVNFTLDENFNESIKSRFRDEFQYSNFSNGEKMRIDLSILFTWRTIARLRNSVATNLLILDEVFDSSLDANGIEEFTKIIKTLTNGTNTFIISHKGDQLFEKFDKVIRFEKIKGFSRMVE